MGRISAEHACGSASSWSHEITKLHMVYAYVHVIAQISTSTVTHCFPNIALSTSIVNNAFF